MCTRITAAALSTIASRKTSRGWMSEASRIPHGVLAIEEEGVKLLVAQIAQTRSHARIYVAGTANRLTGRQPLPDPAATQFQRGQDAGRRSRSDAGHAFQ